MEIRPSGPFWEQPIVAEQEVDLATMSLYRMSRFPPAGPLPWLDDEAAPQTIAMRLARGEITPQEAELCHKWSQDGYIILEGFYDDAILDQSWSSYEGKIADGSIQPPSEPLYDGDPLPGRVANAHFSVRAIDDMLFEPRMSRIVSLLLGAKARPFQTIIGHKSSQQLEHSDSIHMSTYPTGYLAANWIAYEDIDPDSGPLIYYPGSHKLPYLMSEELGIPPESGYGSYHALYEPAIQAQIAAHDLKPQYFLPRKGDVLLWHANLLHGGSKVTNPYLSRKALVCHFFAEGCVCYHDLTGTLAHIQVGADLYQYKKGDTRDDSEAGPWVKQLFRKIKNKIKAG